jgi:cell shape-determining protein MreC
MTTITPNRRRTAARAQLVALGLLIVAVVGVVAVVRTPLASLLWRVGVPLSYLRDNSFSGVGDFFASFSANHALVVENQRLQQELASSSVALMDRDILIAENLDLKSRLGRISEPASSLLAAVVSRPPQSPYDTLMLDVGRNQGVNVGDLVAAGGSVYLGKIDEVYASASRVVLFSAPGTAYHALLLDKSATTSLAIAVSGQGAGSLTAEVPAGTTVHAGDQVVFQDISPELVAQVIYVDENAHASFKIIYMQLPVSIYSLRFVEVHRTVPTTTHAAQ